MAKIQKKIQVIADNLQKVEKAKDPPAAVEVHTVEPMSKNAAGVPKLKGKNQGKKKKEVIDATKKDPVRDSEDKKERFAGYAGFARRVAGKLVGEIRGKPKFWFDD